MDAPIVSFNPLINSINDTENMAKAGFKECYDSVMDVIMYSSDRIGDTTQLKMCMNMFAEKQKEMSALARVATEVNSLTEKSDLGGEQAVEMFDNLLSECLQDDDIDENKKELISSLEGLLANKDVNNMEEDNDSELLVTKTTQSLKDPLTQHIMVNPVKSKHCHHTFECSSIMEYLANSSKRCPYPGCQGMLRKEDLISDFKLKAMLIDFAREQENNN